MQGAVAHPRRDVLRHEEGGQEEEEDEEEHRRVLDEGVADDTVVAQMFKEIRAFRIYDGPSEVHRWAIARRILKG